MLMVGARLITRLFDLATLLVLARILEPGSFGLVAIAMSVVAIVEAALELPLNQALVRLPEITRAQYDTAFTLSLLRGLLLGLILVAAAWPFAKFYDDPRLVSLVCILGVSPVARALISPRLAEYQKTLSFWRDFVVELAGKSAAFAVAVTIALSTGSYWSIAASTVVFPIATAVGSYVLAPYRPRLGLSELRLFLGFVGWITASQWIAAFNWQFERLLLGKLKPAAELGLFTTASDIANTPFLALFGPMLRPLLAAFSMLRTDAPKLAQTYQTATCAIVTLGLPVLVGEALVAEPAVRLVLGERWLAAAPYVQWLAVSLAPALFALHATPLLMAFGETKLVMRRSAIEFGVKFPLAVIGVLQFGFAGIIAARFASELCADAYCILVVRRLVGLSIKDQVLVAWRSVAATLVMALAVQLLVPYLDAGAGAVEAAAGLVAVASAGAVVYVGALAALWLAAGRPEGLESFAVNWLSGFVSKARKPA